MKPHPEPSGPIHRPVDNLGPHLARLVERARERALRLAAEEATLEHLLGALMEDEECAAHEAVLHAFADPETLSMEMLALSPGILVVGSRASLPFSPRAIDALFAARAAAAEARAARVTTGRLLVHAVRSTPDAVRGQLAQAGYREPALQVEAGEADEGAHIQLDAPLFQSFADDAKRALSMAARTADQTGETSIGPAQVALATWRVDPDLAELAGLGAAAARSVCAGRTADATPPPPREVALERGLVAFLAGLPRGAGSLDVLLACLTEGPSEILELLGRHKVTRELLERSRGAFEDPQ